MTGPEKVQRMVTDQPEDTPQNPVNVLPQATGEAPLLLPEERPHRFIPDSNWTKVTGSSGQKTHPSEASTKVEAPAGELVELTNLDVELGVETVQDVFHDYLNEDAVAVQNLIRVEPGLTGGETPETLGTAETAEAMEVDPLMVFMAESMHLPMDTGLPEAPMGTFQLELTGAGYTPSFIGSVNTPPSPIMATDNTLLDLIDPETQPLEISKAPGAGRPEGSPGQESPSKPGMTLWKRKPPPT